MYIERLTVHHGDASLTVAFEPGDPAQDQPAEAVQTAYDMALQWLITAVEGAPAAATVSTSEAGPQPVTQPPRTPTEAETRFFKRYGATIGGQTWRDVQRYLGLRHPKPTTVDGWMNAALAVRDEAMNRAHDAAQAAA